MWRFVSGVEGEGFARWVQNLRGLHGAYLIADATTGAALYAGESHSARLYDTLTRHFQRWRGANAWTQSKTGATYDRDRVLVRAVATRTGARARALQDLWICRYAPRDNGTPCDEVPF